MYRQVSTVQGVPVNKLVKDGVYVRTINGQDGDVTLSGGDRYKTTSTTPNTIVSIGTLTFTVDSGLSYITQQDVIIAHDDNNHMHGTVVSYSGTTLVVDIQHKTGSGTYSAWTINLDGVPIEAITGATDSTLIKTGTTLGLNLGNANAWSAQQTFGVAPVVSTMSEGSVPFFNASGTLSQDNQNFYWNNSAKRLNVYSSLGAERVANGTFTGSAFFWTVGSGWAYSANSVSKTSNGTAALLQSGVFTNGEEYVVSVTVTNLTVGTVTVFTSTTQQNPISANGTYTYRVIAGGNTTISFVPSNTARLTVDNVSARPLSGGSIRTGEINLFGNQSNGSPGTTRMQRFDNSGVNTWTEYGFAGSLRVALGADSSGAYNIYTSSSNGVVFYTGNAGLPINSAYAYVSPSFFWHQTGYGGFSGGVRAGSTTSPTSVLQSDGTVATKVKRVTTNTTLDNTASTWLADASSAACSGNPTTQCSSYTTESTCLARDAHGGCSWFAGNSCSVYNGDESNCTGTTGCTWEQASCSGFGNEMDCNNQTGCSWTNNPQSCSVFNGSESSCIGTTGCTWDTADCSAFNGNESACSGQSGCSVSSSNSCASQSDESSCVSAGCSWDGSNCSGDNSTCSGTYSLGTCSGTYDFYQCQGTYATGNCTGTYGAACSGSASCAGIDDQTNCDNESGCTWSTAITLTLPSVLTAPDRHYWIYNDSTSNADVVIQPFSGDTVNHTTSYTLASYKDFVHIQPFADLRQCSTLAQSPCGAQSGCTQNYANCSWDPGSNTCSGNVACDGIGDQSTCESTTYYSGCSGSYYASINWYVVGR